MFENTFAGIKTFAQSLLHPITHSFAPWLVLQEEPCFPANSAQQKKTGKRDDRSPRNLLPDRQLLTSAGSLPKTISQNTPKMPEH
jgi:hypothetical protein